MPPRTKIFSQLKKISKFAAIISGIVFVISLVVWYFYPPDNLFSFWAIIMLVSFCALTWSLESLRITIFGELFEKTPRERRKDYTRALKTWLPWGLIVFGLLIFWGLPAAPNKEWEWFYGVASILLVFDGIVMLLFKTKILEQYRN